MILNFLFLVFTSNSFAQDCKFPIPVHSEDGLVEACLKYEKLHDMGSMQFYTFPYIEWGGLLGTKMYLANNPTTRNRICKILGHKRERRDYALADRKENTISYEKTGFRILSSKSLKILACSL